MLKSTHNILERIEGYISKQENTYRNNVLLVECERDGKGEIHGDNYEQGR
jgi:hypothetical protein